MPLLGLVDVAGLSPDMPPLRARSNWWASPKDDWRQWETGVSRAQRERVFALGELGAFDLKSLLIPPGLPGSLFDATKLIPGGGGPGGIPGLPGMPGLIPPGLEFLIKGAAERLGGDKDSPVEELLEWIQGEGDDGKKELEHIGRAYQAHQAGRPAPPPPRHPPGRRPHRPPPRRRPGHHPGAHHPGGARPPMHVRGDPGRPGPDPRPVHPRDSRDPRHPGARPPRHVPGDPGRPGPDPRPVRGARPRARADLGDIGETIGILPALIPLIGVVVSAVGPWIAKAAEGIGKKGGDAPSSARALIAHGPEGRRLLRAALRAGRRAHSEGRVNLPPEAVQALDEMDLGDHGGSYAADLPALPVVSRLGLITAPDGFGAPAPSIPAALPSLRELAQKGRDLSRTQVESMVAQILALRNKLITLIILNRAGKLTGNGPAHLARSIALYKIAVKLLRPVSPYLDRVVPGASVIFDTTAFGVAPAVLVAGTVAVAIAIAGAALVAVAGVIAAAWQQAKAAEATAKEAGATRQAAIDTTRDLVRAGIAADPGSSTSIVDQGLETLVSQNVAAEETRSRGADASAGNEIFGLPWWVVGLAALALTQR